MIFAPIHSAKASTDARACMRDSRVGLKSAPCSSVLMRAKAATASNRTSGEI